MAPERDASQVATHPLALEGAPDGVIDGIVNAAGLLTPEETAALASGATLNGIAKSNGKARGVAVVDPDISLDELKRLIVR